MSASCASNRRHRLSSFDIYAKPVTGQKVRVPRLIETRSPLLPIVAYMHTRFGDQISSVGSDVMATESQFRVPEAFSKPSDKNVLNFESVLLGRNWWQFRGNFGGRIEFPCRISLNWRVWRRRSLYSCLLQLTVFYIEHCPYTDAHFSFTSIDRFWYWIVGEIDWTHVIVFRKS